MGLLHFWNQITCGQLKPLRDRGGIGCVDCVGRFGKFFLASATLALFLSVNPVTGMEQNVIRLQRNQSMNSARFPESQLHDLERLSLANFIPLGK